MKNARKLTGNRDARVFGNKTSSSRLISAEELRALRDPYSGKAQTIVKKVAEGRLLINQDQELQSYLSWWQKQGITNH